MRKRWCAAKMMKESWGGCGCTRTTSRQKVRGGGRAFPGVHCRPTAEGEGKGDGGGGRAGRKRCAGNWRSTSTSRAAGYSIRTLVAFSEEVNDKESGPDPFTETNHGSSIPTCAPSAIFVKRLTQMNIGFFWWPTNIRRDSINRCSVACTSTSAWRGFRPCKRCRG